MLKKRRNVKTFYKLLSSNIHFVYNSVKYCFKKYSYLFLVSLFYFFFIYISHNQQTLYGAGQLVHIDGLRAKLLQTRN